MSELAPPARTLACAACGQDLPRGPDPVQEIRRALDLAFENARVGGLRNETMAAIGIAFLALDELPLGVSVEPERESP